MQEQCKTVEGTPCVFPFIFRGKEVTYCISGSKRTQPWCPTQVDSDHVPITGQWGNCDEQCPTDGSDIGRFLCNTYINLVVKFCILFVSSNFSYYKNTSFSTRMFSIWKGLYGF